MLQVAHNARVGIVGVVDGDAKAEPKSRKAAAPKARSSKRASI